MIGPVIGGLLGQYGPRVPFFAAAAFTAVNFFIALAVMRETLPPAARRAFSARRANALGALQAMRRIPGAMRVLFVLLMYQIGHDTLPSTWVWVTMAKFGWTERDIGLSLAVLGFGTIIVQGGLVGLFTQRIGEHRTALLGLACGAIGFVGYAFATTPAMLFASVPLACQIGLTMPALRAILSRATPANAQGELQGAIAGIVSFTAVVIPFTMTHLFSWATTTHPPFPGASFLAAAVALAVGAAVLSRVKVPGR